MSLVAWRRTAAVLVNLSCLLAFGARVEAHIQEGVALGVVDRGSRPAILTNMTAIREEGVDLDSALMRFAGTMR